MKEQVKAFDLKTAFKALDEIEVPVVEVKTNTTLVESCERKQNTDFLVEDYYDINTTDGLNDAKTALDASVAQAKLDKIEKIVDLDAETPDDIQPSYVGKIIVQCPQCMTLFYRDANDIEHSEEHPEMVNVTEKCPNCGNDSGYTVIGKVAEDTPEIPEAPVEETSVEEVPEVTEEPVEAEETSEEAPIEETEEENIFDLNFEEPTEETSEEESDEESDEEEKKEESFEAHNGATLNEQIDNIFNLDFDESLNNSEAQIEAEKSELKTENESDNLTLNEEKAEDDVVDEAEEKPTELPVEEVVETVAEVAEEIKDIVEADEKEAEAIDEIVEEKKEELLPDEEKKEEDEAEEVVEESLTEDINDKVLEDEVVLRLTKYAPELGYDNAEDLINAYNSGDDEVISKVEEFDDGDNFIAIYNHLDDEEVLENYGFGSTKEARKALVNMITTNESLNNSEAQKECEKSKLKTENESDNLTLNEETNIDLSKKLDAHNNYIAYLQKMIEQEKEALDKADNEEIKAAIQRRLDAFEQDLKEALPEAVKDEIAAEELPTPEEAGSEEAPTEEVKEAATESLNNSEAQKECEKSELKTENNSENLTLNEEATLNESLVNKEAEEYVDHLTTENRTINEDITEDIEKELNDVVNAIDNEITECNEVKKEDISEEIKEEVEEACPECGKAPCECEKKTLKEEELVYSEEAVKDMLDSKEFQTPISDEEVQTILADESFDVNMLEEVDEEKLGECINESLINVYENVDSFTLTECAIENNKFIVEGIINFKSGTKTPTQYTFTEALKKDDKIILTGLNEALSVDGKFTLNCIVEDTNLITESLEYNYKINESSVNGTVLSQLNEAGFLGADGIALDKTIKAKNGYVIQGFVKNKDTGKWNPYQDKNNDNKDYKYFKKYNDAEKAAIALSKMTSEQIGYVKIYFYDGFKQGGEAKDEALIAKYDNGNITFSKLKDFIKDNKATNVYNKKVDQEPISAGSENEESKNKETPVEEPKAVAKNAAAEAAKKDYKKLKDIAKALGIDEKSLTKDKLKELRPLLNK